MVKFVSGVDERDWTLHYSLGLADLTHTQLVSASCHYTSPELSGTPRRFQSFSSKGPLFGCRLYAECPTERTPQAQSQFHAIRDRYGNMLSIWSGDNKEEETYDVDE